MPHHVITQGVDVHLPGRHDNISNVVGDGPRIDVRIAHGAKHHIGADKTDVRGHLEIGSHDGKVRRVPDGWVTRVLQGGQAVHGDLPVS